jgi:SAM-dependent methyltransferase
MRNAPAAFGTYIAGVLAARPGPLRVLEIGGGATTRLPLTDAHLTVLDNSAEALARNEVAQEKLLGDAQSFDLGTDRFDVAVFWNVLEHIPQPEKALARACDSLRPGGLLIVRGPELKSFKALVTRYTPYPLHVLFYRRVLGLPDAGREGRAPCKIYHSRGSDRSRIIATIVERGLSVRYQELFVGDQVVKLRRYSRFGYYVYAGAAKLLRVATGRRLGSRETEFVLAAERPRDLTTRSLAAR